MTPIQNTAKRSRSPSTGAEPPATRQALERNTLFAFNAETGAPEHPDFINVFSRKNEHDSSAQQAISALKALPSKQQAVLPFFEGASQAYVACVCSAIGNVLGDTESPTARSRAFLNLICSSQNNLLSLETRTYLNEQIQCFNENWLFWDLDLTGADLSYQNLSNLTLIRVNLSGANLAGANMDGLNAVAGNFSGANMKSADLQDANLSGANLCEADLLGANLRGAKLVGVDGKDACLSETDLCKADTTKADWTDSEFENANMSNSVFCHANFGNALLDSATLDNADLTGVNLTDASMSSATLPGANLTGAILNRVGILHTRFDNTTNFTEIDKFTLKLPEEWDEESVDYYFNQFNNNESGNIFAVIQEINDAYSNLKLSLVHQIIRSLNECDLSAVHAPILACLSNYPAYFDDAIIRTFLVDKIIPLKMDKANTAALQFGSEAEVDLLIKTIEIKTEQERAACMLGQNGFFVQLMALSRNCKNFDVIARADTLYDEYLALPPLLAYKKHLSDNGVPSGLKNLTSTTEGFDRTALAFIFIQEQPVAPSNATPHSSGQPEGTKYNALLLSQHQIDAMLKGEKSHAWNQLYYFENEQNVNISKPADAIGQFLLFKPGYEAAMNGMRFSNLFDKIDAIEHRHGSDDAKLQSYCLHLLRQALSNAKETRKMTQGRVQLALHNIFSPLHNAPAERKSDDPILSLPTISEAHLHTIMEAFDLDQADQSATAQTLFCLAACFAKLSSSAFFGTEHDSPVALRNHAAALLKTARQLDPSVIAQDNLYQEWIIKLTTPFYNGKTVFTCSAIVSNAMFEHARVSTNPTFATTLFRVKPAIW